VLRLEDLMRQRLRDAASARRSVRRSEPNAVPTYFPDLSRAKGRSRTVRVVCGATRLHESDTVGTALVVQEDDIDEGTVTVQFPLVLNKAQLPKLIQEDTDS